MSNGKQRKKTNDPMDETYLFIKDQRAIGTKFPNLPPEIQRLHQELITSSWKHFDKLKQELPQQTEISSL
jgi:hypothetical protein